MKKSALVVAIIAVATATAGFILFRVDDTEIVALGHEWPSKAAHKLQAEANKPVASTSEPGLPGLPAGSSEIRFPDGYTLKVRWRLPQIPDLVSPPFGQHYQALRLRALDGDVNAAFNLFGILQSCVDAFDDRAKLTEAVTKLRNSHMLRLPTWDKPLRIGNSAYLERTISQLKSSFDSCSPISSEQKAERNRWLKIAAEGGLPVAILWRARQLKDSDDSITAAQKAWDAGHAEGLLLLAKMYRENYENGVAPDGIIRSYAALYVYTKLLANSRQGYGELSRKKVARAELDLQGLAAELHQYQMEEAIQLAKSLVQANSACCFPL